MLGARANDMQRKESTVDEIVRLFDLGGVGYQRPETENQVGDRATDGFSFSDLNKELVNADGGEQATVQATAPPPSPYPHQMGNTYDGPPVEADPFGNDVFKANSPFTPIQQPQPNATQQPVRPIPAPRPYQYQQRLENRSVMPPVVSEAPQLLSPPVPARNTKPEYENMPRQHQPYQKILSQNNNFNPMQWIADVYKLPNDCSPIDGTFAGLQAENHKFRKNVVNKLPYMRENFSHMFPINEIESKVINRENALRQSLESLQDFLQTCQNIEHDLADSERKLASIGELSIFPAGVQPQIMKLGHIQTTMNRVENAINQSEPIFYVAVTEAHNAELQLKKEELRRKFRILKDKVNYQKQKAAENKRRSEEYQETNRQIRYERNEVFTMINSIVSSRINNNARREVIEVLLTASKKKYL